MTGVPAERHAVEALARREQSPDLDPETEGPPWWLSYLDDDAASEVIRMAYGPNFGAGRTQVHQVLAVTLDRDWPGPPLRPRFE
jgi:hypothetical protein